MKRFKAVFWIVVGAALGLGGVYWGAEGVRSILADQALWRSGTPAPRVQVGGRVRTDRFILKTYELDVQFQDVQGARHAGKEEFVTLFSSADQREPELHYDPADPRRFVLSWAVDVVGGRWMAALLFLVMGPVILLGAVLIARGHWAQARSAAVPPAAPSG